MGLDPSLFVHRVDAAAERIDHLLSRTRSAGGGIFEIFYGLSGSGKTTFLRTLPKFFESLRVIPFGKELNLFDLPKFIEKTFVSGDQDARIILIERRDNPKPDDVAQAKTMFIDLLETFRDESGAALVIWPITLGEASAEIAESAWKIGRDSLVDSESKGVYQFKGIPKYLYVEITDNTSRNLSGDGIEAFGITVDLANSLLADCETIADFFNLVDRNADNIRKTTWSTLKEKVRPRLWIALPGDDTSAINATVSSLTQGSRGRVDVDLMGEFIDRPDNKSIYVAEWKKKRAGLAHFLRTLDLRLFSIPPNVALAAIRSKGDETTRKLLKQPSVNLGQAKDVLKASKLYKQILTELGIDTTPYAGSREVSDDTSREYLRIQAIAAKDDKPLNKALALLLAECLNDDAPDVEVISEKKSLPGIELKPDIQIRLGDNDFICIEPTWRSSGVGIDGEIETRQNTLVEAHIKKYLLDKAGSYIVACGL